jgi:hypothetical protein
MYMQVTGELRLNGRGYTLAELKKCAGYVMQDDVLNANLVGGGHRNPMQLSTVLVSYSAVTCESHIHLTLACWPSLLTDS